MAYGKLVPVADVSACVPVQVAFDPNVVPAAAVSLIMKHVPEADRRAAAHDTFVFGATLSEAAPEPLTQVAPEDTDAVAAAT